MIISPKLSSVNTISTSLDRIPKPEFCFCASSLARPYKRRKAGIDSLKSEKFQILEVYPGLLRIRAAPNRQPFSFWLAHTIPMSQVCGFIPASSLPYPQIWGTDRRSTGPPDHLDTHRLAAFRSSHRPPPYAHWPLPELQAASVCLGSYKFRNSCPTLSPNLYLEITILKAWTHAGTKAHLQTFLPSCTWQLACCALI